MATTPSPSAGLRAIDRLRKAANFEPIRQVVQLDDGSELEYFVKPLTASEREKAQKNSKGTSDFALTLLVMKALDESGQPLFKMGDIAALKNEVPDEILQKMILAVLRPGGDEEDELDMKSPEE